MEKEFFGSTERAVHNLSAKEVRESAKLTIAEYGDGAAAIVWRRIADAEAIQDHAVSVAWSRILEKIIAIQLRQG